MGCHGVFSYVPPDVEKDGVVHMYRLHHERDDQQELQQQ